MLSPSYDILLVIASIAVSIMASFTGLILTRGISRLPQAQRKLMIVMAALALGGGIWSMHFVAMLAMKLPVPISYDAVYTLGSALIAVLMSGIALLVLHFGNRSMMSTAAAGAIMGNGIVAMHYVGMSGIRGCVPTFEPVGVFLAIAGSTVLGIVALHTCYVKRSTRHIFTGAVIFGLSVVLVHFVAMGWTGLRESGGYAAVTPVISHGVLALLVMLSAFVICGTFLLTAANFVPASTGGTQGLLSDEPEDFTRAPSPVAAPPLVPLHGASFQDVNSHPVRLPFERDKRTYFIDPREVVAIRAEGHYSVIYTAGEKLFCPLSISAVEERVDKASFIRTHRSYLVNMDRVSAFERAKDNGRCLFEDVTSLNSAPVSRTFVPKVRTALGI
ncbi:MAG: MHYT domain-containing protein [Nitratireductor sp.]